MAKRTQPNLKVITQKPAARIAEPPCKLGEVGMSLWTDIVQSYEFSDRASYETLFQCCAAADRAERCRQQIDADGELIRVGESLRSHPLLRDELANRAFVTRGLARLGLDLEPLRDGPGRPSGGGIGISWEDLKRAD